MDKGNFTVKFNTSTYGSALATYVRCGLLVQGFYHKNGYIPATAHFLGNTKAIGFPDIDYQKFSHFWKKIKRFKIDTFPTDKSLLNFLEERIDMSPYKKRISEQRKRLEKFWYSISNEFIASLYELYPDFQRKNISIKVYITPFGSKGGFSCPNSLKNHKINAYSYARIDMPKSKFIEALFSCLLSKHLLKTFSWEQKEAILDYLTKTFLKNNKISSRFVPTIKTVCKTEINRKLLLNSLAFLSKNNLRPHQFLTLDGDGEMQCLGKDLRQRYFSKELDLLKTFLTKSPPILSYDDIATILWKEDIQEKFSLWAINKRMQRLRNKLIAEGLPKIALLTVRNVGYYLNN